MNLGQFGHRPGVSRHASFAPGGYLTPVSGTPFITGDVTGVSQLFYTPDAHNGLPVMRAGQFECEAFDERPISLAGLAANSIFDLYSFDECGRVRYGWSPAWQTSTAGAGARGAGPGTIEQIRLGGLWVNKYPISALLNGVTRIVGEKRGVWLASVSIGSGDGQANFHRSYGQSRRWDVFNPYNSRLIYLKGGDPTASWTLNTVNTGRASNGNTANSLSIFTALTDCTVDLRFIQSMFAAGAGANSDAGIGIGINSTTIMSGKIGRQLQSVATMGVDMVAEHLMPSSLGVNVANAMEYVTDNTNSRTFLGKETRMFLSARWSG